MKKYSLIALVLFAIPAVAMAAPGIPHQFYGTVNFTNGAAPDGLTVETKIGPTVVGDSITSGGKYGYNPNLLFALDPDDNRAGQTVKFFVNGIDTGESATFANGEFTNLALTVPVAMGNITADSNNTITNQTVSVTASQPAVIQASNLSVSVTSSSNTNATVADLSPLGSTFFTGAAAVISGNNILNGYEIRITGTGLTIQVTMNYSDSGIDEGTIVPYRFNGTNWVAIEPYTRNTAANTITFSVSAAATPYAVFGQTQTSGGGGDGGGGGGSSIATPPTNTTISIASGAAVTSTENVTLTLAAAGAAHMMIANTADFAGITNWENYAATKSWTLTSGDGVKTVYAKFRSNTGDVSAAVSDTITLQTGGQVLGETITNVHPNGTLILDNGTIFLIKDGKRSGFRNPEEYFSHGYTFSQTVAANSADKATAEGSVMKALEGALVLDKADGRTVYMIGLNGTKRGFTSADVFKGLGYSFNGLLKIDLSDYTTGNPIASGVEAHPEGALILDGKTVWWVKDGKRQGFESEAVFTTYGFTFGRVVASNAADMTLPTGPLVKFRDGTLVNDQGTVYVISDGKKLGFRNMNALTSRGYAVKNSIKATLDSYEVGNVIE
ncbi:MAG: hypothetical protein A3C85_00705 [Candidatus Doudnabacteria bacterium RIFCSPHIGHO2_02_FULL_48_21]|uniref:Uncharacterized protein n=1 Tax=Candidatus Doudnabacteria bacterium RIFCSPLOWO2_02_FULL_48_13 TaxID=1817845 RepID=A0A1F5Q893_9BACT|nr:MAG: hypothetical protein A3K05_04695 [Candidatus Doudnabacteria bacterium RIFCSPHIGHO2_01_48_18]OGE77283.1 MAG: hypothetical protein A2668_02545 [Candidatus Doudnabacteria bacterium RIFCSPHIGHO2_01_FULL_48_180]OGE91036.1 MAG: hypothetical protein A3F44_01785 [Candidatus Doudnabacteria bacterium RIFCSPHIGHO2_12_FULL_47_25]OGE92823.1 MAG: hypothetical protein A3C85_00705 [Candidatus Doudnabacteria bacterium RIFCSPHIGHO2_02_FULL_48_21]OGE96854.1 MAG: hypothetical protein A3A83_03940 [Candidatu